jgi:hypothetical protein
MCAFFAVDLATGQQMIHSIGQMQVDIDVLLDQLNAVEREVNLGDLEEARAVAAFNRMVAGDGEQSARAVLVQFRTSLERAAAAVQQGMINYSEVEAAIEREQQRIRDQQQGAGHPRPGGRMRAI